MAEWSKAVDLSFTTLLYYRNVRGFETHSCHFAHFAAWVLFASFCIYSLSFASSFLYQTDTTPTLFHVKTLTYPRMPQLRASSCLIQDLQTVSEY